MKKILALLISVFIVMTMLASCDILGLDFDLDLPGIEDNTPGDGADNTPDDPDDTPSDKPGENPDDDPDDEVCEHSVTTTVGKKDPTCTALGYTGDVVCATCDESSCFRYPSICSRTNQNWLH